MRRFLSCVLAGAALLAGTSASASGLQVAPVSIDVPATQNAEGLWLSNTGDTPVRAQVRVFRWTQENDAVNGIYRCINRYSESLNNLVLANFKEQQNG